jgi:hypothetical protein
VGPFLFWIPEAAVAVASNGEGDYLLFQPDQAIRVP